MNEVSVVYPSVKEIGICEEDCSWSEIELQVTSEADGL